MTSSVLDYFTTTYSFNSQNQLTQVTSPSSPTVNYGYDSNGNLNSITWNDGAGVSHSVARTYSMPGRDITSETTTVGSAGVTTFYAWNSLHQPTKINYRGKSKTLTYNSAGDLLSATDFTGARIMSATYDGFGNPVTQTDQAGHTTKYTYDNSGYVSTITDPLGLVTSLTHDPLGNLVAASYPGGGGSMSRSFDYLGRETQNTTYFGSLKATTGRTFSQFASGAPSSFQSVSQIGNFNSSTNVAFSSDNPGAPSAISKTTPMGSFNVMDASTGNFGSALQKTTFPKVK
jgi:YD repeat-containing protein